MTFLLALLSQVLHCALMLSAAPTVAGLLRWGEARLAGRSGPHPMQPWRDLARLLRKQVALAENASPVFRGAAPACLAASMMTVALVPSFTLGMAFEPMADLLLLAGLLALQTTILALAALDAGTAQGALAAARVTSLTCLAEPAVFLVILTLGVLGGTTNLDLLIGLQREAMLQPAAVCALAAASLAAVALVTLDHADALAEFSGIDLAMVSMSEAFRRLFWLDLIGALFVPLGMAPANAGPAAWIVGLLAWAARLAVLTAALALLRSAIGHIRRVRPWLAAASMLGLLAAVLAIASAAAV
jgi:formate hydrogenlyase subunit 4